MKMKTMVKMMKISKTKNLIKNVTSCYKFSKEQEGELVEWFQQLPELYDKNHADYRKKNIRDRLMKAKADQYPDCSGW